MSSELRLYVKEDFLFFSNSREHDKGPNDFFSVMFNLLEAGLDFRLSVLGEQFTDVPGKFLFIRHSIKYCGYTVNLEIFVSILFSRNFACEVS